MGITTGKGWLDKELEVLLPALAALTVEQEGEIAQLCADEIAAWKERPSMKKFSSLRPVMTATRKAIKEHLPLTPANRYKDAKSGEWQHIALKHMNFTVEEWEILNAIPDDKFEERLHNQQLITNPQEIVMRAEHLLHSDRWDELVTGLAVITGRRLTEILKTGRFFPKSMYTVMFDGQLKRRDIDLMHYEIPTLVNAELVIAAWRKLRTLEDCTKLDNDQVAAKYSKIASETAVRQFTGLIPQRHAKEDIYTHAFRAVYARIAVLLFCPVYIVPMPYVSRILGHYHVTNEKQQRDAATTEHYFDYAIGDGNGQVDGRQGIRLSEPHIEVLEAFQRKGDQSMNTTEIEQIQGEEVQPLETKKHKTRGTFTVKPATYDEGLKIIDERGFGGTGHHDRLLVDLMAHDTIAHQMYALLDPLKESLGTENPVETLQALIRAYQSGSAPAAPAVAKLLEEVSDEPEPITYLHGLVERDRKFQTAIANRHSKVDYSTANMVDLRTKYKTPEAATERFRRAVNAMIKHNDAQTDPLHQWYINAAMVRRLVGGKNELVQAYLKTRQAEIEAHHGKYSLTPKQNDKNMDIASEIIVE